MRPRNPLDGSVVIGGTSVPRVIAGLIALTLLASVAGALTRSLTTFSVLRSAVLAPQLVSSGEVWRLVTWIFVETEPLALVFGCLALFWFGRDLTLVWGRLRFLSVYLGFAAVAGGVTCLIGRFLWPQLNSTFYLGNWAVVDALLIAWGVLFPGRRMLMYFVLPIGGRGLIAFVLGMTLLYALFDGFARFIPHFVAEGLMLVYVREPTLHSFFLRLRLRLIPTTRRRSSARFRVVGKSNDHEPPRWLN